MTDLQTAARALLEHWDSLQTADLADAEESVEALRQALEQSDWVEITKGQILAMHANTATPEEFGYEIEALCRALNRL